MREEAGERGRVRAPGADFWNHPSRPRRPGVLGRAEAARTLQKIQVGGRISTQQLVNVGGEEVGDVTSGSLAWTTAWVGPLLS